jgi:hypothetical protein
MKLPPSYPVGALIGCVDVRLLADLLADLPLASRDDLQVVDVITGEEYDQEYAHVIGEGNDGTRE